MANQGPLVAATQATADATNALAWQYGAVAGRPAAAAANTNMVWIDTATGIVTQSTGAAWVERFRVPAIQVIKASDETVNNSDVLQNDNDLVAAVGNGEVWRFELALLITSNATANFRYALASPGGSHIFTSVESTSGASVLTRLDSDILGGTPFMKNCNGTALEFILLQLLAKFSGAGNLQLQWCQNTANVSDTKVLAGSSLRGTRLA